MPAVPKPQTTKDRGLLDCYQGRACMVCAHTETTIGHHLITKGAGGPDEMWNLIPLCHVHHDEVHKIGLYRFADRYPRVLAWVEYWGWEMCGGKMLPPQWR